MPKEKLKKPNKEELEIAEDRLVSSLAIALAAVARELYDKEKKAKENADSK